MNLSPRLSAIIAGTATVAALVQPQPALAQKTAVEIREIAEAITVRIDGPGREGNNGSGTIVDRQGSIYTVLTNWHVVDAPGRYTIRTSDGRQYTASGTEIQRLPGVDLAILRFSSEEDYRVAEKGNSNEMTGSSTLYAAGWYNPGPVVTERIFDSSPGRFINRLSQPKNGYSLLYSLEIAQPGMSGGPVLNDEGRLIAINGLAQRDLRTGQVDLVAGIAIETFENWRSSASSGSSPVTDRIIFSCDTYDGAPATIVRHPARGTIPFIRYVSEYGGKSVWQRCEEVTARFQLYDQRGMLKFIIVGERDGQPALCVSRDKSGGCDGLLFIAPPGRDLNLIIQELLSLGVVVEL